ncbi:hypothetical protein JX265_013678 [Neoarthrinium moseri]|uniref:Uncharacterized protein n=1 Tax=Neoarthrinium moseri TaxID=1658444 RepID=A0A9P9W7Y4_9PEZI|nr:hypothetical protein JX265_013678 [Neoarthrinium moseri]
MPANFGDPEDRRQHPENYAPGYRWMADMKWMWDSPGDTTDPTQFPSFVAIKRFLGRAYMQHGWILEEIAMATFPAFLIGDEIVSWMEVLRLNRNNEELIDNGAKLFPEEYRSLIHCMPLGTIYTLLKEFDRRQKLASSFNLRRDSKHQIVSSFSKRHT